MSTLDKDAVDRLYQAARQDVLKDPGYLLEMIETMNKQKEYKRVVDE